MMVKNFRIGSPLDFGDKMYSCHQNNSTQMEWVIKCVFWIRCSRTLFIPFTSHYEVSGSGMHKWFFRWREKRQNVEIFGRKRILERFWRGNLKNSEDENIKRKTSSKRIRFDKKRKSWKFYSCSTRKYFEILDFDFELTIAKDENVRS